MVFKHITEVISKMVINNVQGQPLKRSMCLPTPQKKYIAASPKKIMITKAVQNSRITKCASCQVAQAAQLILKLLI